MKTHIEQYDVHFLKIQVYTHALQTKICGPHCGKFLGPSLGTSIILVNRKRRVLLNRKRRVKQRKNVTKFMKAKHTTKIELPIKL